MDGFPEAPLEVLEATGWKDVTSRRQRREDENIVVLENRALTRGVEILVSMRQLYRKRCVALMDNTQFLKTEITQFLVADLYS